MKGDDNKGFGEGSRSARAFIVAAIFKCLVRHHFRCFVPHHLRYDLGDTLSYDLGDSLIDNGLRFLDAMLDCLLLLPTAATCISRHQRKRRNSSPQLI